MNHHRQESSIQRATNWLHDNVLNNYLTRKEFLQMSDTSNGRLSNEESFQQRIYDTSGEQRI